MDDTTGTRIASITCAATILTGYGPDTPHYQQLLTSTADTIYWWITEPTSPQPALASLIQRIHTLEDRMTNAENRLDATNAAITEIDTELNNLAARLDTEISQLDEETAARLRPFADRLRAIGADPNNPVPPVEPTEEV